MSVQVNSETPNSFAESFELDQGVLPRGASRIASCPFFIPIPKNCPIRILCRNLLERETSTHLESSVPLVCCETVLMTHS